MTQEGKQGQAGSQDRHRGDRRRGDPACVARLGQETVAGRGQAFCCLAPRAGWRQPWGQRAGSLPRRPGAEGVAAKRSHPAVPGVAGSSCKKQTTPLAHSTGVPGTAGRCYLSGCCMGAGGGGEHPGPFAPASCLCPSSQPVAPPNTVPRSISQGRECTPAAPSLWAPAAAPTWTESSPSSSGRMR